jgi:type II secretory pathway component PulL
MRIEIDHKKRSEASALVIVLLLISLMLVFVLANSNALFQLKREVKLLDARQQKHWAAQGTNSLSGTNRVVGAIQAK